VDPDYLDPFYRKNLIQAVRVDQKGSQKPLITSWDKPVFVLIDESVMGGGEVYAFQFKKTKRAKLVGASTPGYPFNVKAFFISKEMILVVPTEVFLMKRDDLRGKGVPVDIPVKYVVPLHEPVDPQLMEAIRQAAD